MEPNLSVGVKIPFEIWPRVLEEGRTVEQRRTRVSDLQHPINQQLLAEMQPLASKKDLSFKLLKKVWFLTRGRPEYYRSKKEIDAQLSIEAAQIRKITVPPEVLAMANRPAESTLEVKIIQNLIKAADASKEVKEQLGERGFNLDEIERVALESIETHQPPPETQQEEQQEHLRKELTDLSNATAQIEAQLQKQGMNVTLHEPLSSRSARPAISLAIASAPAAIAVQLVKLDAIKILEILGSGSKFNLSASVQSGASSIR